MPKKKKVPFALKRERITIDGVTFEGKPQTVRTLRRMKRNNPGKGALSGTVDLALFGTTLRRVDSPRVKPTRLTQ